MLYTGAKLKEISFPLGGIGSGCIGLAGNGQLIEFEIFNRPNKGSELPYAHIAVRCFDGEGIRDARVLVSDAQKGFNGHKGLPWATMNGLPHFRENTFLGEYPVAKLTFSDEHFPGDVILTAFNPYIPLDSKNSSLPAAFFEVEFYNPTDHPLRYEAALSMPNPFRSVNRTQAKGVTLCDADGNSDLTIMTDAAEAFVTDYWYRGWRNNFYRDDIRTYWREFSTGADLRCRHYTEVGECDHASVSGRVTLAAGERKTVRFVLCWNIPECVNYWVPYRDAEGKDISWKNYYTTLFENSFDCATYALENWGHLFGETEKFKRALYTSTVDDSIKQAIGSALSVLKSPTVMRTEDGSLYGFEGSSGTWGDCEGLCQHVWNYAYVCCYLFPDLERSIRNNEFTYGVYEHGATGFRLPMPFDRGGYVNFFEGPTVPYHSCVDGQMGCVFKTYREWKFSGDDAWLRAQWPTVKAVLSYAWNPHNTDLWDENADGVLEGSQHNTLDTEIFGPSGWLQGFYLAALAAAAEMAAFLEDAAAEAEYRRLFENGYAYTKEHLFNGKWFIQKVDVKDRTLAEKYTCTGEPWNEEYGEIINQFGEGCMVDQLCGEWHARLCGLPSVFDPAQTERAALSIYKYNLLHSTRELTNLWRVYAAADEGGTILVTYPEGVEKPTFSAPYADEIFSGMEYALAGVLIATGHEAEALDVMRTARARYDGERRNPWDDAECGHNYVRSMSAFALLPLTAGFTADLSKGEMTFDPKTATRPFKAFWCVGTAWGEFQLEENRAELRLLGGHIDLAALRLPFAARMTNVRVDGADVPSTFADGRLQFARCRITTSVTFCWE